MATVSAPYVRRAPTTFVKYGLNWPTTADPIHIERSMLSKGGQWKGKQGQIIGLGMFEHFINFQKLLWPHKKWHKWNELQLDCYIKYRSIGCIGPASCVAGHTRIDNPITGEAPTIKELCDSNTAPMVMTLNGPSLALVPFVKGFADIYEVTMENGARFTATGEHRVLTSSGFLTVSQCGAGTLLCGYDSFRPRSTSDIDPSIPISNADRWRKIIQDSESDCPPYFCSCDEQPLEGEGIFLDASPSQFGAQAYMACASCGVGGWVGKLGHTHPCQCFDLLSIQDEAVPAWRMGNPSSHRVRAETFSHASCSFPPPSLLQLGIHQQHSYGEQHHSFDNKHLSSFSSVKYKALPIAVSSIRWVGCDYYYDLQVPNHHHYFAEGAVHHNSGKSFEFATDSLADYYVFPDCTTVLCCSTTREMLEQRIWGEIKRHHSLAKAMRSWIPGHIIESRQRIITSDRSGTKEGRDFRNGLLGVPCKKGNDMVGLGDFAGVKNKRVRLLADELSLLPRVFVDAISNLDKNPDFKGIGMGNPKDTTDALGVFCEPSAELGGWDGGIDQGPGTKTWATRRPQGICIQLPGSDSPNLDGQLGIPLITQEQIDRDVAFYGKDSLWFSMMDEGKMPRGQGSRRVLTRNMCIKHRAMEEPIWKNSQRIRIAFLDAAYKGVGGDRCVYGELEFGEEVDVTADPGTIIVENLASQKPIITSKRVIIALRETTVIPIVASSKEEAEDQIVQFVMRRCSDSGIAPGNFYYDSGMRTGLVSAFSRLWSAYSNPIDCGGSASDRKVSEQIEMLCKDYYSKFITELWYSVRHAVEASQWRGLTEEVINEFSQREWTVVGRNKIEVEPKDKMKLKTGRSPDLADAVAIGLEGAKRRGFVINRLSDMAPEKFKSNWMDELKKKATAIRRGYELKYD